MTSTPFTAMERAVDIVNTSPHPTNKIAATLFHDEQDWHFACTNYWPEIIDHTIGREAKIGDASGTIHAETACVFEAAFKHDLPTHRASLALTDPPCPNCVKNLAEAGIVKIYIDHKGFAKDFAQRRSAWFEHMSLRLAEKAGISTYEINRKEQTIIPITLAARDYRPADERPVVITAPNEDNIYQAQDVKYATALCRDKAGQRHRICAPSHPALGFQTATDFYEISHPETKYSYIQEACNRLLMTAARNGLRIIDDMVCCNDIPTSREQVNMIGAGIRRLHIPRGEKDHNTTYKEGLDMLERNNILTVSYE